jgi:hypothetical protein
VLQTFCHKLQEESGTGGFDLLIISKFLASKLPLHDKKSPEIAWGEIRTICGSTDLGERIHCHFSRMWSGIVLKEGTFFFSRKIRPFLPYLVSEIPPKVSGVTLPTDSLPWRHPMLQNDPFGVEEENDHDFTRYKVLCFYRL